MKYNKASDLPLLERLCSGTIVEVLEFARGAIDMNEPMKYIGLRGSPYPEIFNKDFNINRIAQEMNTHLREQHGIVGIGYEMMLVKPTEWANQSSTSSPVHLYVGQPHFTGLMMRFLSAMVETEKLRLSYPANNQQLLKDQQAFDSFKAKRDKAIKEARNIGADMLRHGPMVLDMFLNPEHNLAAYLDQQKMTSSYSSVDD